MNENYKCETLEIGNGHYEAVANIMGEGRDPQTMFKAAEYVRQAEKSEVLKFPVELDTESSWHWERREPVRGIVCLPQITATAI